MLGEQAFGARLVGGVSLDDEVVSATGACSVTRAGGQAPVLNARADVGHVGGVDPRIQEFLPFRRRQFLDRIGERANSSAVKRSRLSIRVSMSMPITPQRLWNRQTAFMRDCMVESPMPPVRSAMEQYRFGHHDGMPSASTVNGKRSPGSSLISSMRSGVMSDTVLFPVLFPD
jgi:hypothetical protein